MPESSHPVSPLIEPLNSDVTEIHIMPGFGNRLQVVFHQDGGGGRVNASEFNAVETKASAAPVRLSPSHEASLRAVAAADTDDPDTRVHRGQMSALLAELDAVRAERDQARRDAELQRAAYFHEAARLLESTGRDDDAVNLLDNVADGILTHAEDQNDNRRRIYIDGKGNGWISVCSDEGTEWVVPVQPEASVEQDVRDVADETGSLREIGRCW